MRHGQTDASLAMQHQASRCHTANDDDDSDDDAANVLWSTSAARRPRLQLADILAPSETVASRAHPNRRVLVVQTHAGSDARHEDANADADRALLNEVRAADRRIFAWTLATPGREGGWDNAAG